MKNKKRSLVLFIILIITILVLFASCTKNERAKAWGGKAEITLPRGQKLINATWKESNLWYLTRPMVPGDSAVTYTFQEESNLGVLEGTYIIHERK